MKRAIGIIVSGIALAVLAGVGAYHWGTTAERAMLCSPHPELSWLQREFNLEDAEVARIAELHDAQTRNCAEMCRRIDATNALIHAAMALGDGVTPELEKLIDDAAGLRADCQKQMLTHFFEVSRAMPPEQGKRYLAWMKQQVLVMSHEPEAPVAPAPTHAH